MSDVPADLRYTDEHEWIRTGTDGTATVGITDHAQKALGDIVFFELPAVGRKVEAGESVGVVESVKAASDLFSPLAGEIVEANSDLVDEPESVNDMPYEMWLFRIRTKNGVSSNGLLDAKAYRKLIGE
ncbi:glycine cleavage system protein GcvH [Streptomyces fuscichromogenes]|uniref:Glycine cleavage system H protein n=1 Tax=Streptomyces fuscichromogenes TaxID=1324013 RepID=A0A918CSI8_9ACTN|nr:glycine cleavage system protein GcvH [Streptomyces fuscichromogenes]GGN14211.1 glycine cleavage system H protein [Streptomyces fuscichromogenes]